ncbi:hypothetical protein KFL_010360020 [Klebsormidium nitens]|uniref:Uncharacterized protein n=1 Tax=Klebsormidium nitens TaxID=105231 RepID=A0A1Y1IP51_KLENI|nr:hypothetical protein KFL_010360020 [Klebsormidium nitens]|eukprot:GAQ92514.1 hypothetical protein KFL_010360020 [Klebsormidium nitens]
MAPCDRGVLGISSGSHEQRCHPQSQVVASVASTEGSAAMGAYSDDGRGPCSDPVQFPSAAWQRPQNPVDPAPSDPSISGTSSGIQEQLRLRCRPWDQVVASTDGVQGRDAERDPSAAIDPDSDVGEGLSFLVQIPLSTVGDTVPQPAHWPSTDGVRLEGLDGILEAVSLPQIRALVKSARQQMTVRGQRVLRRSAGGVCRLAREACRPEGLLWTKAAWDGALQAAMSGLEGLVGVPELALVEGFRRVVVSTAAAHMEGLRQRGREGRSGGVRVRVQAARTAKVSSPNRGSKRTGSDCNKQLGARSDPHTLHCHECGATAEFGLRGSKEGVKVKYFCEGHATCSGCFRVDKERRAWAEDWELRGLRALERRLEEELRNLGGASCAMIPPAEQPSASRCDSAPLNESQSSRDGVSMPMSRSLIEKLLHIAGIEQNPGPPSNQATVHIVVKRADTNEGRTYKAPQVCKDVLQDLQEIKGWPKGSLSTFEDGMEVTFLGGNTLQEGEYLYTVSQGAGPTALGESSSGAQVRGEQAGASFDTSVRLVGADSEGINRRRVKGGFFTPRTETVHKILLRVQESGVLILAATPCSGKTSICQLVYQEAKKSPVYDSDSVFYVNCARVGSGGKSFEDVFLDQTGAPFSEASKSPTSSPEKQQRLSGDVSSSNSQVPPRKKKLLILDEVQTTYDRKAPGHSLLWPLPKEVLAAQHDGINILLSASRGSNPSADGLPSTPIHFSEDQRIPLRPRPGFTTLIGTSTSEPALQFTMDEYKQVFDTFCASIGFGGDQPQLQLRTLYIVIEATTERHPGSVLHILDVLKGQSPSNYAGRVGEWAAKTVEFVTSPRLLGTLSGTRAFPNVDELWDDKVALDLIRKVLASGGKEHLHVIRNWSLECAKKAQELVSLNLSTRGGVLGGVLEAHFQFELYSAITSLLPEGFYLSPTVGKIYGLEAYVDFVLHGLGGKWALELLVDGRDLTEHERRFEPNGRYHPMVLGKQIDAWIVVDLRNPSTGKPRRVRGPGVCHVIFDPGYEKATIDFGNGNEQEVILTGRA